MGTNDRETELSGKYYKHVLSTRCQAYFEGTPFLAVEAIDDHGLGENPFWALSDKNGKQKIPVSTSRRLEGELK